MAVIGTPVPPAAGAPTTPGTGHSAFRARFPEFLYTDEAIITESQAMATSLMNVSRWGDLYASGLLYLTAHFVALDVRATATTGQTETQVSSETFGPKSFTYNVVAPKNSSEAMYTSTSYGQRYVALRRQVGAGGCVV